MIDSWDEYLQELENNSTPGTSWGEDNNSFQSIIDAATNPEVYEEIWDNVKNQTVSTILQKGAVAGAVANKTSLMDGLFGLAGAAKDYVINNINSFEDVRLLHQISKKNGGEIPGKKLVENSQLSFKVWHSLSKMENVLGPDDDYSALSARILNLMESFFRDLLVSRETTLRENILEVSQPKKRKLLERWFERNSPVTFGYVSVWTSMLEVGWKKKNKVITEYLQGKMRQPGSIFDSNSCSEFLENLRPSRNSIMHANEPLVKDLQYQSICQTILGCTNVSYWCSSGTVIERPIGSLWGRPK